MGSQRQRRARKLRGVVTDGGREACTVWNATGRGPLGRGSKEAASLRTGLTDDIRERGFRRVTLAKAYRWELREEKMKRQVYVVCR